MNNSHPAPYPVALANRCVELTNAKIVLDPFMGSGTTELAAKRLGRNYIGIELSPDYCEQAEKRIENVTAQQDSLSALSFCSDIVPAG